MTGVSVVVVAVFAVVVAVCSSQLELLRIVYHDVRWRRWRVLNEVRTWDTASDGGVGKPVRVVDDVLTAAECSIVRGMLNNPLAVRPQNP